MKRRYSVNPKAGEKFDALHATKEQKDKYLGHRKAIELSLSKAGKTTAKTGRSGK